MVMRRSEFIFILLAAAAVFFILGYFVAGRTRGQSFTVSAESKPYNASVSVPEGDAPSGAGPDTGSARIAPLDINSASAAELASLPGMSSSTAEAIVSFREAHGAYDYVGQLLRVSGVDRELFLEIERYLFAG